MRYKDIICPVCGAPFQEEDDVVVCPECGTPHHRACWMQQQSCANEALHEQGFEWKFPENKDPLKKLDEQKRAAHSPAPDFEFKNGERVIECPRCGAFNYENDAFCMKCRAPLKNSAEKGNTPWNAAGENGSADGTGTFYNDPRRMIYDNQRFYGGLDPNVMIDGIPVCEYSDYIGGTSPGKMIRRFAGMERYDRKVSFNFAAFVFGPIWLFYRKMYRYGVMILVLFTLCTSISGVLVTTPAAVSMYKNMLEAMKEVYSGEITLEEYYEKVNEDVVNTTEETDSVSRMRAIAGEIMHYISRIIWLSCGFIGDRLYRKKIKADVEEARKTCVNMEDYRRTLFEKGGTSAAGAVIGVAASLAAVLIGTLPIYIIVFAT